MQDFAPVLGVHFRYLLYSREKLMIWGNQFEKEMGIIADAGGSIGHSCWLFGI